MVADLPPIYSLYASFIAPLIGILFGSNNLLFTGPVGVITVLVYTSLSNFALLVGIIDFTFSAYRICKCCGNSNNNDTVRNIFLEYIIIQKNS